MALHSTRIYRLRLNENLFDSRIHVKAIVNESDKVHFMMVRQYDFEDAVK